MRSPPSLDELRAQVGDAERQVLEADARIALLREARDRLPRAPAKVRYVAHTLSAMALVAGIVILFEGAIRPRTDFDASAEQTLVTWIEGAEAELQEMPPPAELLAAVDEAVRVSVDGRYPASAGDARGRVAYPALTYSRTGASEVTLRWANIGRAACTVGERPLVLWSMRVLGWLYAPKSEDGVVAITATAALMRGLPEHGEEAANGLRAWLMIECGEMRLLGDLMRLPP